MTIENPIIITEKVSGLYVEITWTKLSKGEFKRDTIVHFPDELKN